MKKYVLDLINHEIEMTRVFIERYEVAIEKGTFVNRAKKRLPVLKNKLTKITKYKEQLEKLL